MNMTSLSHRPATPDLTPSPPIIVNDQEMVNVNQKLKELGIEQTIQLPQICVVGDQSTGKSSLIEALSMIKVPRDAACCTRCPLEVNLIKPEDASQPWSCKVSLVRKYDLDESANPAPTKRRPLGAWVELARAENVPFAESDSKEDVPDLILRAQAATLNPHMRSATFLSRPVSKLFKQKFSPNAVRLDIVQHELPSLSFVDLPGLVTRQDEMYLVELVKNLVAKYAQSERSINLLTISMTSDYDTSNAFGMILTLKADSRTLAVMTKPDRFPPTDSMESFLGMLSGANGPRMEHGYHVVMMDPDLTLSHAAATQKEENYFKNNERWTTLGEAYHQKLGRQKLSERLSLLLQKATRRNLPISLRLIQARLGAVHLRLDALPPPPGLQHLSIALTHLINAFKERMSKLFEGGGDATQFTFRREWNRVVESFRGKIMNSRPRLLLSTKDENAQKMKADRIIREAPQPNSTPHRGARGLEPICVSDEEDTPSVKSESTIQKPAAPPRQTYRSFSLEEIRVINETHAECGADPQMFPGARKAMKKMSVQSFDIISEGFLESTQDLVRDHISKHTEAVFHDSRDMPLFHAVMKHVHEYIDECCRQQYTKSMRMCETEKEKPFTTDKATSAKEAKRYKTILQEARNEYRLKLKRSLHEAEQIKSRARRTDFKMKEEDLEDDEWDTEIELLANARAYHQIAASRFVDNVCQSMYAYTFPQLATEMANSLEYFLGPMRPEQHDQMVKWMSENPERQLERNRLLREQASLLEAQTLVQETLGNDAKRASIRAGKRKVGGDDGNVDMGGSGTEQGSEGESPLKRTKFEDVDGLQPSVEVDMDEDES
jgi:GTP-binding protein EngB required for normal cell division